MELGLDQKQVSKRGRKMNKLLQTIKENNERFAEKYKDEFNYNWLEWIKMTDIKTGVNFNSFRDGIRSSTEYKLKSHITQSRIKELEALVGMLKNKKQTEFEHYHDEIEWQEKNRGTDSQLYNTGYEEALDDIIQTLQDTIKELKETL
jgi:hypothetical protein